VSLLGHAKLETTALYTRVAVNTIRDIKSPLERAGRQPREPVAARLTGAAWRGPRIAVWRSPTSYDVFRAHGAAWRKANAGHVSLAQLKAMSAIESCRTSALGGHIERCEDCAHTRVAYNSCRNRHCPKCQGAAARQWLEVRPQRSAADYWTGPLASRAGREPRPTAPPAFVRRL
jgi:transposase-like zinc-binding protein